MTNIIRMAVKKASQSVCRYKISAIGLSKKGEVLGSSVNKQRFSRYGGGIHAEMGLIARYGTNLKTIIICRVNAVGKICSISPCQNCSDVAKKLGIKIISVEDL
jgi:cytidine deaminase